MLSTVVVVSILVVLNLCAFSLFHARQSHAELQLITNPKADFVLTKSVTVTLAASRTKNLQSDKIWHQVGELPEGRVYKTDDQVLSIDCHDIDEAFIVVKADRLTGFYQPAEKTYIPLKYTVPLRIEYLG